MSKIKKNLLFTGFFVLCIFAVNFVVVTVLAQTDNADDATKSTTESTIVCATDTQECSDGSFVNRNPNNNCEFYECPKGDQTNTCSQDTKKCSDGTEVGRDPKTCEFYSCPESVECAQETKECPDGSYVSRNKSNNCEFDPCPKDQIVCTGEYKPICGEKKIECATASCKPIKKIYGNMCELNQDGATYLHDGQCKSETHCANEYAPVCASNGKTYHNRCIAEKEDVFVKHDGECVERREKIHGKGVVRFIENEGGFYGLVEDFGNRYMPIGLKDDFKKDGLRVEFSGEIKVGVMTTGMWGDPIELFEIERIQNELPCYKIYDEKTCDARSECANIYETVGCPPSYDPSVTVCSPARVWRGCRNNNVNVKSINIKKEENGGVRWSFDGFSEQGFKVVWSKSKNPTYPTRAKDRYLYFGNPYNDFAVLYPFDGSGTYYVRVCEYLGGQCGVYSNEISVLLKGKDDYPDYPHEKDPDDKVVCGYEYEPVCGTDGRTYPNKCVASHKHEVKIDYFGTCKNEKGKEDRFRKAEWSCGNGLEMRRFDKELCQTREEWKKEATSYCPNGDVKFFEARDRCGFDKEVVNMRTKARYMTEDNFDPILDELNELRDLVREQEMQIKYLTKLKEDVQAMSSVIENMLNNFITYGVDDNTKKLGAGERAAVMHSFKKTFGRLPEDEDEFSDAIKIANGRWPNNRKEDAEKKAKKEFKKIYKRVADMNDPKDDAAITVMAYGLRQKAENRNLDSEKMGIETFKGIYGHNPEDTDDWNIMQAITYSGSSRMADSDKDFLPDDKEKELGTDPNNPDTDGDGYLDGEEVDTGNDPLN